MDHPYKSAPSRAFWKRAVSDGLRLAELTNDGYTLVRRTDKVASAGSCFAANIVPYLEAAGLNYIKKHKAIPGFGELNNDNFSYAKFSAAYGNIYTVRQAVQLLQRTLGEFRPAEDRWTVGGQVIDPFRPGLRFPASSNEEFDLLTRRYLESVKAVFCEADVFVFTLGLTEAWVSNIDGAVFPACPGTISGEYDPARHSFHNFTVDEVRADLFQFISLARSLNPNIRFVITVSPVPLVATLAGQHVLTATTYSKSVLRVAAAEAEIRLPNVAYFPAYEIVTGPHAPFDYFEPDRRSPSKTAIDAVMKAFLLRCEGGEQHAAELSAKDERVDVPSNSLSKAIADAECEEAAAAL